MSPPTRIEMLTPDFRGRAWKGARCAGERTARRDESQPGNGAAAIQEGTARAPITGTRSSCCGTSSGAFPSVPTKSGIMVGLGETDEEILEVMRDLRAHDVDMLTVGQYLQPTAGHLPVLALRRAGALQGLRKRPRWRWASATQRAVRWCARAIMRTSRRRRQALLECDCNPIGRDKRTVLLSTWLESYNAARARMGEAGYLQAAA